MAKKELKTLVCSVPKPLHDNSEDAFVHNNHFWAVADGAGGVGIFAAEWAKYLLEKLPPKPFAQAEEMIQWADGIWEEFYQSVDNQSLDVNVKNKFLEEGSLATLIAVYPEGNNKIKAIAYGDSAMLLYDTKKNTLRALPDTLATYVQNPHLINWKAEILHDGIKIVDFKWTKQEQIIISSDALAQYLLLAFACLTPQSDWETQLFELQKTHSTHRIFQFVEKIGLFYEKNTDFHQAIWQPLCEAMKDETTFKTYIYQLSEQGLIANDDYTGILLKWEKN